MTNRSKSDVILGPFAACEGPSVPGVVHTDDRSKAVRILAQTTLVKPREGTPPVVAIAFRAFFARYRDSRHGGHGADMQQACKTATVDDWTATMSAVGAATCE